MKLNDLPQETTTKEIKEPNVSTELSPVPKKIFEIKKEIEESKAVIGDLIKEGKFDSEEANKEKDNIRLLKRELERLEDLIYIPEKNNIVS